MQKMQALIPANLLKSLALEVRPLTRKSKD